MMMSFTTVQSKCSMFKNDNLHLCLMVLLCLLITSSNQLGDRNILGDGSVDASSIVSDLQEGKRGVFAVGYVSDKLTLFVSGIGDHKNPSGGYQVTVDDATDGVLKITSNPVAMPYGIPSDDKVVKFVCKDSAGDNLVAMSKSEVGSLLLPKGPYEKTAISEDNAPACFQRGSFHLSSNEAGHFYAVIPDDKNIKKFKFFGKTIRNSEACYFDGDALGKLCINEISVSIKDKCDAPSNFISGTVGPSNVYLFDDSNTVFSFEASIFKKGGSGKLTKQTKEKAFVGKSKPPVTEIVPRERTTETTSVLLISLVTLAAFFIILALLILLYILGCCEPCISKCKKEDMKKNSIKKNTTKGGIGSMKSKQKKSANRKSSFRSSRGGSRSGVATPSRSKRSNKSSKSPSKQASKMGKKL